MSMEEDKLYLNKTTLKSWLLSELDPITDADPSLVTDYIIALLNHDNLKDSIKLKAFCLNQLQDFLESDTTSFVDKLFIFLSKPDQLKSTKRKLDDPIPQPKSTHPNPATRTTSHNNNRSPYYPPPSAPASSSTHRTSSYNPFASRSDPTYSSHQSHQLIPTAPAALDYCKDYHHRGFCARGVNCAFQHIDAVYSIPPNSPFMPFPRQQQDQQHQQHQQPQGLSQPHLSRPPRTTDQRYPRTPISPAWSSGAPNPTLPNPLLPVQSLASGPPHRSTTPADRSLDHNRRRGGEPKAPATPLIVVENIPQDYLNQSEITSFFMKFGTIVNLAIESSNQRATITFATVEQSQQALASPEAIFGNRFVRVYRGRPPTAATATTATTTVSTLSQSSPTTSYPGSRSLDHRLPRSALDQVSSSATAPMSAHLLVEQERAAALESNAREQTNLIARITEGGGTLSVEEKQVIMRALRKLSSEATILSTPAIAPEVIIPNSFAVLTALRQKAEALGIETNQTTTSYRGQRGQTLSNGGRSKSASAPRVFKLDNRVKSLKVADTPDAITLDALRYHFEKFGSVEDIRRSLDPAQFIVDYTERSAAEKALVKGLVISGFDQQPIALEWNINEVQVQVDKEISDQDSVREVVPMEILESRDDDRERSWNR